MSDELLVGAARHSLESPLDLPLDLPLVGFVPQSHDATGAAEDVFPDAEPWDGDRGWTVTGELPGLLPPGRTRSSRPRPRIG